MNVTALESTDPSSSSGEMRIRGVPLGVLCWGELLGVPPSITKARGDAASAVRVCAAATRERRLLCGLRERSCADFGVAVEVWVLVLALTTDCIAGLCVTVGRDFPPVEELAVRLKLRRRCPVTGSTSYIHSTASPDSMLACCGGVSELQIMCIMSIVPTAFTYVVCRVRCVL